MAESKRTHIAADTRSFTARNIKKDFTQFEETPVITKEFHLELGEHYETKIVEDKPTDWLELANKDLANVGLANVIRIIEAQGLDIRTACRFQDSEAMDLSELDPLDPHAYQHAKEKSAKASAELESLASKYGVSVESLVAAAISGNIQEIVKNMPAAEKKEGE